MNYFEPKTLANLNNWIVWKLEEQPNATKPTKTPYNALNNKKADITKPYNRTNLYNAKNSFNHRGYDGVGYVFCKSDNLVFIDIDNCIDIDTGEFTPLAEKLINLFNDTYIEISQSEKGIHIVCKGTIENDKGRRNDAIGLEIYNNNRYMAFTGNCIAQNEPTDKQKEINYIFNTYLHNNAITSPKTPQNSLIKNTSVDSVIKACLNGKNGDKFKKLYSGDWLDLFKSQSEADQSIINIIMYYSNYNEEITKEIFYNSELGKREKAQRSDYINAMLLNARQTANNSPLFYKRKIMNDFEPKKSFKRYKNT